MKKTFTRISFILCTILVIACHDQINDVSQIDSSIPHSISEMQHIVLDQLNEGHIFYWDRADVQTLWSAGMLSDSIYSIGYKPEFMVDINHIMHELDIESSTWRNARLKIENTILDFERLHRENLSLTMQDLQPMGEVTYFPQLIVQLTSKELLQQLRQLPEVRFVEPLGFSIEDHVAQSRSSSGCNGSPNYNIDTDDFQVYIPNTKVAWNFFTHSVEQAWSEGQGDDVTICIIDTGASNNQDNLGSQFTSGQSGGRYIQKYSTHYSGMWWWRSLDSPHDQCGHGTSMCGQAAGPRGDDGNAVGVAYKSNLVSVRAVEDVIISTSNERQGVRDALFLAANHEDVQIASMSIGTPFYSSTVADGIYYAYNNGLALFAAAGTSLSWTSWYGVIFPATMSETIAVTGVKDAGNNIKCETCHSGSQVDFVIVMERNENSNRTSIALANSTNQPKYIGGSSAATATAAGIAGLVWANNPSYSRNDLVQALKESSEYYPSRHGQFGWGRIDALLAINGGI